MKTSRHLSNGVTRDPEFSVGGCDNKSVVPSPKHALHSIDRAWGHKFFSSEPDLSEQPKELQCFARPGVNSSTSHSLRKIWSAFHRSNV